MTPSTSRLPQHIKKRNGTVVDFQQQRITNAVYRAMRATGEGDLEHDPSRITERVAKELIKRFPGVDALSVEDVQDIVEESLIVMDFPKTAKAYIIYRHHRSQVRERAKLVSSRVRDLMQESKQYFRNALSEFVYFRSYSRWNDQEGRRETWVETVDRYVSFMKKQLGNALSEKEYQEVREMILSQSAMPSMRLLWSAGKAAEASNATAYNCSYIAPKKLRDLTEIMYLSMNGCGVGFSVESQTAQQFPIVKWQTKKKKIPTYVIEDSKEGWCEALLKGLQTWYGGGDIEFDYSQLRPAGARLKTMGGRSSGPEPLRALMDFARGKILSRQGKRLSNIDIHDIICKVGEVVVAGGVRRTALISLSDLDDVEMRDAKIGQFYLLHPQRSMANNSAVYNERPSTIEFMKEWMALAQSGSGERGIFNRGGLKDQLPKRRWKKLQKHFATVGTNPCGEIILRSKQFCNLTEVVARHEDTEKTLLEKMRVATIIGTFQSTMTNFKYLSKEWKQNCEEERLLGVSITGQWDCPAVRSARTLKKMKEYAIEVNKKYARKFGINASTAITCVKPSGTVSQLVDASSGMHARHAPYYIRRIRVAATDPLFHMLKDQKYPYFPEVGQSMQSATTFVLEFPVKAPDNAVCKNDLGVNDQLEYWKLVKTNYTEHNPSVTVSVGSDEWIQAANWLYEHWSLLGGLSFLPREDHVYSMAPYEEISEKRYKEMKAKLPEVDFSQIVAYEKEDQTEGAKEYACVAGVCEVDIAPTGSSVLPGEKSSQ